jgi:succinyl-diaminopimelate desuccinylase
MRYIFTSSFALYEKKLVEWVEHNRNDIISFLQGFLRAPSPNPPGDTRIAATYVEQFLKERGIKYRVVGPDVEKPNIISNFQGSDSGRSLILNGHIDVFPVGDGKNWSTNPWGGEIVDGRVYGRGACDMKAGTTASIWTYVYLHSIKKELKGKVTLTIVSDEESGGRLGSGWLVDNVPEVLGDCCLNGEPSSPYTLRFGEKGPLWLKITIMTSGGHGAYPHLSQNAIKIAAKLITDLETLSSIQINYPENLAKAIREGRDAAEKALGAGGADVMEKLSVNIGTISGGLKINMIPSECTFEVDLRLPPGLSKEVTLSNINAICSKYPEAKVEEIRYDGPNWSPPDGEMAKIIRKNSKRFGIDPKPTVSLGASDLKFWRMKGIPSYYYGPTNHGMGTVDEYVEVEELIHVVKVHLLSAYDFLNGF